MSADTHEPPARDHRAGLELLIGGRRIVLPTGREFVLGRGAEADLDVDHPRVSRRHLVITAGATGWAVHDTSRNGTFQGDRSRIGPGPLPITGPTRLRLGDAQDGPAIDLVVRGSSPAAVESRSTAAVQGRLSTIEPLHTPLIRIGRSPDNDVVLSDLLVSRRHCELRRTRPGSWTLVDLHSPNGTFVNGERLTMPRPIAEGDVIGVGHVLLELSGDQLVAFVDRGENSFEAADLDVVTSTGTQLLHSVGFALRPNTLLAVIGPSGAGKSTLLGALVGTRPATSGTVRYAGRDLYADYDELRHRIALVPQDDVLHTQLTVRQALTYAARLRFPADTSRHERSHRIEEVLADLDLTEQADQRISRLSGGQRKRTSVALELLTKPSMLFLDEPTSGLDPAMDRAVMHTLRGLADDGHTVVVVTHSLLNLDTCDQVLILAAGGHIAYLGPPAQAPAHFGAADFTDIYLKLAEAPGPVWAERFRISPHYAATRPAPPRTRTPSRQPLPGNRNPSTPNPVPRQQGALVQFTILARRYLAVIACDRQYVGFLLALPFVLSLLAWAVPGTAGLSVDDALAAAGPPPGVPDKQPPQLLLILIIGASLMGAAASIRELVKERAIYQRERAIGLSIGAYLSSKIAVLIVITGLQAAAFALLGLFGRAPADQSLVIEAGHLEILLAILAVTVASMLTGLLISAAISNADRGMPLLVVLIMVQLILCGGLFEVYGRPGLEQASWIVPARWGFSMVAATTDLSRLYPATTTDPLWEHSTQVWAANLAVLAATAISLAAITYLIVKRLDPVRRPRLR